MPLFDHCFASDSFLSFTPISLQFFFVFRHFSNATVFHFFFHHICYITSHYLTWYDPFSTETHLHQLKIWLPKTGLLRYFLPMISQTFKIKSRNSQNFDFSPKFWLYYPKFSIHYLKFWCYCLAILTFYLKILTYYLKIWCFFLKIWHYCWNFEDISRILNIIRIKKNLSTAKFISLTSIRLVLRNVSFQVIWRWKSCLNY